MRTWGALILLFFLLCGCATLKGTGKDYAKKSKHVYACYYLALASKEKPEDKEVQTLLENETRVALEGILKDYDEQAQQGMAFEALGTALHLDDMVLFLKDYGVGHVSEDEAGSKVDEALGSARKKALEEADRAIASGKGGKETLAVLRRAMALLPKDKDILHRYESLRKALTKNVVAKFSCNNDQLCKKVMDKVIHKVTEVRRELMNIVTEREQKKVNAKLTIALEDIHLVDTDWKLVDKGVATAQVQKYDKFMQPMKDARGLPIFETVSASYAIYARETSATVVLSFAVDDLVGRGTRIVADKMTRTKTDRASFYEFSGDERALAMRPDITQHGTNQMPPRQPEDLLEEASMDAGTAIAEAVLSKVEY